ncbi:MAG TPA: hypothetical protein DCZ13_07580 [Porticoccaceae bacterium]|nr:hypothetical protein [Porticoccaceae bacterium]
MFGRNWVQDWARDWGQDWTSSLGGLIYSPLWYMSNMGQINLPTPLALKDNTRTSIATAFDHEGRLVTGKAGEIMLDGGRRVQQLLSDSSDMTQAPWVALNGAVPTSDTITFTNANSGVRQVLANQNPKGDFVVAVTVSGDSTTFDLELVDNADGSDSHIFEITATATPVRYYVLMDNSTSSTFSGALGVYINRTGSKATPGTTVTLSDWMLEEVTGQSNQNPSNYLDSNTDYDYNANGVRWYTITNGNSVASNVVTEAAGTALSPVPQVLTQPSRTNNVWPSRDFTHANWVATNITKALDAVGIDGLVNGASSLTATAANATVFNTVTLASAGYTTSFYVRRKTGTGTIELTENGGTSYTDITSLTNSSTYTRVDITTTQANPSIGFRIVTSGDAIEVDAAQLETGTEATNPIKTTTAAATRDNDQIDTADFDSWFNSDEGVSLLAMTETGDWSVIDATRYLYGGTNTRPVYRNNAVDGVVSFDGTSTTATSIGHTPGQEVLIATIWSVALSSLVIGYTPDGGTTWTWDASPAAFSGFSPDITVTVGELLQELCTFRGALIYSGLPPGSSATLADVQQWCEDNALAEVEKIEGK